MSLNFSGALLFKFSAHSSAQVQAQAQLVLAKRSIKRNVLNFESMRTIRAQSSCSVQNSTDSSPSDQLVQIRRRCKSISRSSSPSAPDQVQSQVTGPIHDQVQAHAAVQAQSVHRTIPFMCTPDNNLTHGVSYFSEQSGGVVPRGVSMARAEPQKQHPRPSVYVLGKDC